MSYDQGYWHTDSCFANNLDEQYAGTHIAVYIKWCIEKGFLSKDLLVSDADALASIRDGQMSMSEYFEKYLDWKFGEWNLNEEGNAFTKYYYDRYLEEVSFEVPSAVLGPESNVDFPKLYALLDERLRQFQDSGAQAFYKSKAKSWWKFW
ncbi:hypothetical protein GO003_011780 [Methylicorpusculum oleiharenae]|uniref:DUF7832 domain-containing protein n=1 Tax=Methylicorpusculum oleiharenae TaxID=1338687 RepID=UPI001359B3E7|nr:hypothetical protein [Methylicorpusculum oleiharenae]MCD2451074.1 hypothetical protein [Methylicorpusculum oleiharenae]